MAASAPPVLGVYDPSRSGNTQIDGILSGWHWPQGLSLTYGFPHTIDPYFDPQHYQVQEPLHDFAPASAFMETTFDSFVLGLRAGNAPSMTLTPIIGFTNLKLAKDQTPSLNTNFLIAHSSDPSTAWGYYPGKFDTAEGDIWLGPNYPEAYGSPTVGSYGHMIAMHEFGHTLGLKHTFALDEDEDVSEPFDTDFYEYSLMSYSQAPYVTPHLRASAHPGYAGVEYFPYNYPQTYMMLDIAALQHLYGANYTFRSTDTVYRWSPTTGEVFVDDVSQGQAGNGIVPLANFIFQTIWDGGGTDTYDLSDYSTDLSLNLEPGKYSAFSDEQRPYLGYFPYPDSYRARGNVYNSLLHNNDPRSLIENAKGGTGNDTITGNQASNHLWGNDGNDTLQGGHGDDILDGGAGFDVAMFPGAKADYLITKQTNDTVIVANQDGQSTLVSISQIKFSDQVVTLDPNRDPTDLTLSNHQVYENAGIDDVVGILSATDPDGDPLTYRLISNPGGAFRLDGTKLRVSTSLDYETTKHYDLTFEAKDPNGATAMATIRIEILDAVEGPPAPPSNPTSSSANIARIGTKARDTFFGAAGNDSLYGAAGDDRLYGLDGNDLLIGGLGNDILAGGIGRDTFLFDTPLDRKTNVDRIADFNPLDDTIELDRSVFGTLLTRKGALKAKEFRIDTKARDKDDHILYNKKTGVLSYDADGSGKAAAIAFAKLSKNLKLTYHDFHII